MISEIYHNDEGQLDFKDAVKASLQEVVGAYGIVVMCSDEPDSLFAARMGSPLVLGVVTMSFYLRVMLRQLLNSQET